MYVMLCSLYLSPQGVNVRSKAVFLRRNAHVLCVHSTKRGYTHAFTDGKQNKRSGNGSNEVT